MEIYGPRYHLLSSSVKVLFIDYVHLFLKSAISLSHSYCIDILLLFSCPYSPIFMFI